MFTYCNNNPVMYEDDSGCALRPTTVVIFDGASQLPPPPNSTVYDSPEEAALAFAFEKYNRTREVCALIFEVQVGSTTYYDYEFETYGYSTPAGNFVDPIIELYETDSKYSGRTIIGEIHTHLETNSFSSPDKASIRKNLEVKNDYVAFLACPNGTVIKFNPQAPNTAIYIGTFEKPFSSLGGNVRLVVQTNILH